MGLIASPHRGVSNPSYLVKPCGDHDLDETAWLLEEAGRTKAT